MWYRFPAMPPLEFQHLNRQLVVAEARDLGMLEISIVGIGELLKIFTEGKTGS